MSDDDYPCDDAFFSSISDDAFFSYMYDGASAFLSSISEMTAKGLAVDVDLTNTGTTLANISDPPNHSVTVGLRAIEYKTDDIDLKLIEERTNINILNPSGQSNTVGLDSLIKDQTNDIKLKEETNVAVEEPPRK